MAAGAATVGAALASAASLANIAAIVYPLADGLIREKNAKKAATKRKNLSLILNQYQVKIDQLRSELEKRGLRYNQLMDALSGSSPVGRAHEIAQREQYEYAKEIENKNAQINKLASQQAQISSTLNKEIEQTESKGLFRTITGDKVD